MAGQSHWLRYPDGTWKQVDENFARTNPHNQFYRIDKRPRDWTPPQGLYSDVATEEFMSKVFQRASTQRIQRTMRTPALQSDLTLDRQGLIRKKEERFPNGQVDTFEYDYDQQDRLMLVRLNGEEFERYTYNEYGARIASAVAGFDDAAYDYVQGKCVRAGDTAYEYARNSSLTKITTAHTQMFLDYGEDNGLNSVVLPSGTVISYRTGRCGLPHEKRFGTLPVERIHWRDMMRLRTWDDLHHRIGVIFHYEEGRIPHSMTVIDDAHNGRKGTKYILGWDQCGTIKAVCNSNGHLVKKILYDSFGNVIHDSNPALALPLGFAGGLVDQHTGFVRFGYRDYDPQLGRFTDRDPLGDTGGDHDLYEYCVDDPVNKVDPRGLEGEEIVKKDTPDTDENQKEAKNWIDNLTPPLLRDKDDPVRIAAERQLAGALTEWGGGDDEWGTPCHRIDT